MNRVFRLRRKKLPTEKESSFSVGFRGFYGFS